MHTNEFDVMMTKSWLRRPIIEQSFNDLKSKKETSNF